MTNPGSEFSSVITRGTGPPPGRTAATIRPRRVNRRPGFCITAAVWDTVCRDAVAVRMETLRIKLSFGVSQFDRTPVRSYASSTELVI